MKNKLFYAGMITMSMLTAATSCSKNETPIVEEESTQIATGEQIIMLDMQDTDVLASRSRPLYSTTNQGAEKVTDVKLFIFEHQIAGEGTPTNPPMKLVKVLTINNWDQNSSDYNYGRKYSLKLEGNNKLTYGKTYTILAVGQDESSIPTEESIATTQFAPYKIIAGGLSGTYISTATNWTLASASDLKDKTWNASAAVGEGFLTTAVESNRPNEAEIFSGVSQPIDIVLDGGFTANVLLKRQVAGVLGYFTKIPAIVKNDENSGEWYTRFDAVKKIRLVAHAKNTQIDLSRSLYDQGDDATNVGDEYVVNGFNSYSIKEYAFKDNNNEDDKGYKVYEIDLSKWFTVNKDGAKADDASYWYGTNIDGENNIYFEDGSYPTLGESLKYIIAEDKPSDWTNAQTLTSPAWVNALSQSNSYPAVATNSVLAGEFVIPFFKNKDTDNHTFELQLIGTTSSGGSEIILKKWNVKLDASSIDTSKGDNDYSFNIYRNHLYQIGKRGGGDNPTNPGDGDKDDPQPLDKDQDLTIKINDQWEFIHDMEIE